MLLILALISFFIYRARKRKKEEKTDMMKEASIKAGYFRAGLIMIVLAIISVVVSQNADFSYTSYETRHSYGNVRRIEVTKYNTDLKNALLYGGLFIGLVGAIMAIVANPFTQPVAKGIGASKFCSNCGSQFNESESKSFCDKCGTKL